MADPLHVALEKERAERERKAAQMAKQMAKQPPQNPDEAPPGQPTEPREAKVTITDADLEDARKWWDSRFPELKGLLDAPEDEDE